MPSTSGSSPSSSARSDRSDQDGEDDAVGGEGARGGDPHGRTGADTTTGGTGPGGPQARAGGDQEGSETRSAVEGSHLGSVLGVEGGSEGGRFGGEGKPGDDGVTMGGAIAGGVIAVPEAIKGVVDVLRLFFANHSCPTRASRGRAPPAFSNSASCLLPLSHSAMRRAILQKRWCH
jgi:hypothetical protein